MARNDLAEINRVLDAGAMGLICPLVNDAAQALAFARACRYPLDCVPGDRSYGPGRGLLVGGAGYAQRANAQILALAMIETQAGLDTLEAIVAIPTLDGISVGARATSASPSAWAWPPRLSTRCWLRR